MSSKERFLYFAIVFFGVYYLVNMYSSNEKEYIIEYSSKIEALEAKVDSLHTENNELVKESKVLEDQLTDYDKKIKNLNLKINVIKNETQQKISAVDFFGDDELERFFTERYKHLINRQYQDSIN